MRAITIKDPAFMVWVYLLRVCWIGLFRELTQAIETRNSSQKISRYSRVVLGVEDRDDVYHNWSNGNRAPPSASATAKEFFLDQ